MDKNIEDFKAIEAANLGAQSKAIAQAMVVSLHYLREHSKRHHIKMEDITAEIILKEICEQDAGVKADRAALSHIPRK